MSQIHLDLQPTVGAWFIGAIASVGLLGIATLQSWIYFMRFPGDPGIIKALVLAVWALVFVKCTMSVHAGYFMAVVHWGDVFAIMNPVWSINVMQLTSSVGEFLVHLFFTHKVWMLTRKRYWWLPMITLAFSLAHFGLALATFVSSFTSSSSLQTIASGESGRLATAGLSCGIGADWIITISHVIFLCAEKKAQSDIGFAKKILSTLIFYAINVSVLISVVDVAVLILQNIKFKSLNLYQIMCFQILGDLYANSLLACLNMRTAASSLGVPAVAISREYPSSRTLEQNVRTVSRHSDPVQGSSEPVMEIDLNKGGMFKTSQTTIGHNEPPKYGSVLKPSDWENDGAITLAHPDIVITRTIDHHVT